MMQEVGKNKFGWLRWLPGVLISLIAIYILYNSVNWHDLGSSFQKLNFWILLIAIPIFLVSMVFRTLEWWIIANRKDNIGNMFLSLNVGYLANNILPFRVGEIVRAMFFGQSSSTGTFYALSTIIIERIFDIGLASILLFISIPRIIGAIWAQTTSYIAMGLVVVALIILFSLANNREKFEKWIEQKSINSTFLKKHVQPRLSSLLEGLVALTDWKVSLSSFILLAISWAIALAEYFLVMRSFIPEASIWWAIFSLGIVALGVAIPSAPANIGVFEASLVASLSIVNVNPATSLAFALLIHFYHVVINSLIGLIGVLKQGKSLQYWFSSLVSSKNGSVKE